LHGRVHHEFRLRKAWKNRDLTGVVKMPYYLFRMMQTELQLRIFVLKSSRLENPLMVRGDE